MSELTIVAATYYKHPEITCHFLFDSCNQLGLDLVTFGKGVEWGWWLKKANDMANAVQRLDTEYVLCTDSFDVFFQHGEEEIMKRFREFDSDIVISTEVACYPDKSLAERYPEGTKRYINGGGYIGKRSAVYDLLRAVYTMNHPKDDDQLRLALLYVDGYPMALDQEGRIFQTMNRSEVEDDCDACLFHFNGRVKGIAEWYKKMNGCTT